jgi:hypothetical protein
MKPHSSPTTLGLKEFFFKTSKTDFSASRSILVDTSPPAPIPNFSCPSTVPIKS